MKKRQIIITSALVGTMAVGLITAFALSPKQIKNAHADITYDEIQKLTEGLDMTKDESCYDMGNRVKKVFENSDDFSTLMKKNATSLPTSDTDRVYGWSHQEIVSEINSKYSTNAEGGVDIPAEVGTVNVGASSAFNFSKSSKMENISEEYFEYRRTYIQTRVTTVDWDSIDPTPYFSDSFKNSLENMKNLDDAIKFISDFGSHIFGQDYYGGVMILTEHVASNTSIVKEYEENNSEYSLSAEVDQAISANNSGKNGSVIQQQVNNQNTTTENNIITKGGKTPPATSIEELFTFKQEYASEYESGFLHAAWFQSVNKLENNIVCKVGSPYSIWKLIHNSSYADASKEALLKAAFDVSAYTNYSSFCDVLEADDKYIEKITYKTNAMSNPVSFSPRSSLIRLPNDCSFTISYGELLTKTYDESDLSITLSDKENKYASVDGKTVTIKDDTLGKTFTLSINALGAPVKTIVIQVTKGDFSTFSIGYGTKDQPYLIENKKQLKAF